MLRRTALHQNWFFAESSWLSAGKLAFSKLEWLPARVPGHVHLDLRDSGVIGDPFERMNELGCQWVDEKDWSYRTTFSWQPDAERPLRVLRFEGLDTVCRVLLNGELVVEHDNMFVPLELDVSDKLRPGQNELRVDFVSAVRIGLERLAAWTAAEGLPTEIERLEERSFVRKVQCMFGWDWGPRLVSCGIWRPVELLEYQARISDVWPRQEHLADGRVRLDIASSVEGSAKIVHVLEGEGVLVGDGELVIDEPRLWWPNGLGQPHLYTLRSYACPASLDLAALPKDPAAATLELDRLALDCRTTRVGLRTLRLRREADVHGESFEFEVNGHRLWALGANWIPDHSFPSTITVAQYRERLESAKRCGMNMLRVWGGGLYETGEFYDLCDELGILVWQDFAFACAYYPDTGVWQEIVREEAEANVRRLRSHPSLALWCGNNENLMMFQQRWGDKARQPPRYLGEHLYDRVLPEVVAALDPATPYIPSSPCGGPDANGGGYGDQHYWDVWHGRGDWIHYRDSTARFASEYGFASAPSLRAWRDVFPQRGGARAAVGGEISLATLRDGALDPIVRWHDKTNKGYETFRRYVFMHYPQTTELEAWTYYSQLNQRDAMRAAVEHFRRSQLCRGSLIWQLNDCWPVQSWALIDSLGQPKPAWFELARLQAPALLCIKRHGSRAEVWALLDNARDGSKLEGELVLSAYSLSSGAVLERWTAPVSILSGERRAVLSVDTEKHAANKTVLVAALGELRATSLLEEPKHLELPPPATLQVSLAGDQELAVESSTPLVDLFLWDDQGTSSFAANALTLPQPGVLHLGYRGDGTGLRARSLAGEHELRLTRARL